MIAPLDRLLPAHVNGQPVKPVQRPSRKASKADQSAST
jgi:hypothetical protein